MGAQNRVWTWGPALLCFAVATLIVIPDLCRSGASQINRWVLFSGVATAAYIGTRAWFSPVHEFAAAELLLVAMSVSTFVVFQNIFRDPIAQKIIIAGIACLVIGHVALMAKQLLEPEYSLVFRKQNSSFPAGFYAHYSYGAAFLIPTSLLLLGFGLRGSMHGITKALLIVLSALGMIAIFYTKSRGGLVAAGGGFAVLMLFWIFTTNRDGKKWGPIALIAGPLVLLTIGIVSFHLLMQIQQGRENSGSGDLSGILDNTIRLFLLGIAVSTFLTHPILGGGSRSYSWESLQFWDVEAIGPFANTPGHVHNEFVQTLTDYGIIGAVLVFVLLTVVAISCASKSLLKTSSSANSNSNSNSDAWRIGGIAGLAGLFIHANFEGIFRTAPGAVLLALSITAACCGTSFAATSPNSKHLVRNGLLVTISVVAMVCLGIFGWKATLVSKHLWGPYFSKIPMPAEEQIGPVSKALDIWPLPSLYQYRADLYRDLAGQSLIPEQYSEFIGKSLADFSSAGALHPFDPANPINSAILYKATGRAEQASASFEEAIRLQGGLEGLFQAHFEYTRHLYDLGATEMAAENWDDAIAKFELAVIHIEKAFELGMTWTMGPMPHRLRVQIYTTLGEVLKAAGLPKQALEQLDHVATLRYGDNTGYLASEIFGERAQLLWEEQRKPEALRLFLEAQKRVNINTRRPFGVTKEKLNEWIKYLEASIQQLKQEGTEPSEDFTFD